MKRLLSLLCATAILFSLAIPAFAASNQAPDTPTKSKKTKITAEAKTKKTKAAAKLKKTHASAETSKMAPKQ
jgi:hypothetical protein